MITTEHIVRRIGEIVKAELAKATTVEDSLAWAKSLIVYERTLREIKRPE